MAETFDKETQGAFLIWMSIMNEMANGAFAKGYREPTEIERVQEWDSLAPEQLTALQEHKGQEWVVKQAAEIDKLRRKIEKMSNGS